MASKQQVDAQAIEEAKRLFDNYDSDKNGYLDKTEFEKMLKVRMTRRL
jgi:Ca2+-binding EF-hand superfamily protein